MKTVLIGLFFFYIFASPLPVKGLPSAIGGIEVESISLYPYQSAIYSRFDSGSKLCSGAILSRKFVVTCAHCLQGSKNSSVFYGSQDLSALDFTKNQVIDRTNYRIHPKYSQYVNDVALIMMNIDIEFTEGVQPLTLPSLDDAENTLKDKSLSMASWGYYSDENVVSNRLRFKNMETISSTECASIYPPPLISSSVICTKDSHCAGDSGSMLVEEVSEGKYVAVGLASFSYDNCKETNTKPAVFMRIASYLNFINNLIDLTDD